MSSKSSCARQGEQLWAKMPKANTELFALTYGAIVTEIITDSQTVQEVNDRLESMGYNIGVRLIDEYHAKSAVIVGSGQRT